MTADEPEIDSPVPQGLDRSPQRPVSVRGAGPPVSVESRRRPLGDHHTRALFFGPPNDEPVPDGPGEKRRSAVRWLAAGVVAVAAALVLLSAQLYGDSRSADADGAPSAAPSRIPAGPVVLPGAFSSLLTNSYSPSASAKAARPAPSRRPSTPPATPSSTPPATHRPVRHTAKPTPPAASTPAGLKVQDGFLWSDGSVDPYHTVNWGQSDITLKLAVAARSVQVEVFLKDTPGLQSTGTWSTVNGVTVTTRRGDGGTYYRFTAGPWMVLRPGQYVFAVQYNHASGGRDAGGDSYSASASAAYGGSTAAVRGDFY